MSCKADLLMLHIAVLVIAAATANNCSRPTVPANGAINPDKMNYTINETVTYTCNAGYQLSGDSSAKCTEAGWSNNGPQCNIIVDYSTCGKRSPSFDRSGRIYGGTSAANGSWPWIALVTTPVGDQYRLACGGSILSSRWILTAGQCAEGSASLAVFVGGIYLDEFLPHEQVHLVQRKYVHPSYRNYLSGYDVGLLYLSTSITFNEVVRPICLPPGTNYEIAPKTKCYFAGWGRTSDSSGFPNQLREADLIVETRPYCQDVYKRFQGAPNSMPSTIMCAGPSNKDICQGDGGGPLMCDVGDNTWYQYGIGSFGEVGCRSGPSFLAKVDEVYSWIQSVTNLDFSPPSDVNECNRNPNPCGDRQCTNYVGGYTCGAISLLRMRGIWMAAVTLATTFALLAMN